MERERERENLGIICERTYDLMLMCSRFYYFEIIIFFWKGGQWQLGKGVVVQRG